MGRRRPGSSTVSHQSDQPRSSRRWWIPAFAIVILGLSLRVWALRWGLPNDERLGSYHPDEAVNLVQGVLDRGALRFHADIGFYNYGSLYFLIWQVFALANAFYGFVTAPGAGTPQPSVDTAGALILVGRLLSAALGTATILVVMVLGRLRGSASGALLGGLFLAIAPLAVVHSHFATVDAAAAFLVTCAIGVSALAAREGRAGMWLAAGVLSGLAGATRYNCGLVVLAPLAAAIFGGRNGDAGGLRRAFLPLLIVLASAAIGFLVGCPGAVLNPEKFYGDLTFELQKSREGMGLLFRDTGAGWWYHLHVSLAHGLGWPLLIAATAGLAVGIGRRKSSDLILLVFPLAYYLVMGGAAVRFARYMLPILPVLCLLAGEWLEMLGRGRRPGLSRVLAVLVALVSAHASLAYCRSMARPDARDEAAAFLRNVLDPGATIAFATVPWYWSPPLSPVFTAPVPGQARRRMILAESNPFVLRLPSENREWDEMALAGADAVVVSDLEAQDAVRLKVRQAISFLKTASQGRRARTFGERPRFLGIPAMGQGYLPVDMLYVCPRVTVYWTPESDGGTH